MTDKFTEREWAIYNTGYNNGESSGYADWTLALEDEFELEALKGPRDFIAKMTRRMAEADERNQVAMNQAMAAYRSKTATLHQLCIIEDSLCTALRLFIAMGNEPNSLVPRGLQQALDNVRREIGK